MNFGLNDNILQAIITVLARHQNVLKAIVFGSRANGDYRYNSDIDLAIYCMPEIPVGLSLELDEAAGIYKIDVVDMAKLANPSLRQRIEEQGIEIYRRPL